MPELPEVEMVVRTLRPRLVGEEIRAVSTSGLPLRRAVDRRALARACVGARVLEVRRVGKYWLIDLSTGYVLLGHLGMTGRLSVTASTAPRAPHTHAVFALASGRELRYVDPRRFGLMRVYPRAEADRSAELTALGLDPFDARFTVAYLEHSLGESRRDIKAFLMDQSRIAGLGNIYVCEALFHAGIAPTRIARRLCKQAAPLHAAIVRVLDDAIKNRGTSFRDFVDADGAEGDNEHHLFVYGRQGEPCRRCKAILRRLVQGGRSTFFCPKCQGRGQR